ncbi:hypothetical protein, partial [Desulfoprunum benzoelyticum]|uniref:hypothetical protein n=1 Tax=Desulfoprunum benzoelyticum TaxID=1506996 RepID=UPI001F060ED5
MQLRRRPGWLFRQHEDVHVLPDEMRHSVGSTGTGRLPVLNQRLHPRQQLRRRLRLANVQRARLQQEQAT